MTLVARPGDVLRSILQKGARLAVKGRVGISSSGGVTLLPKSLLLGI
jgi:hypothetical protein